MTTFDPDRRKVLMAGGTAVAIALAGCSGDDDDGDDAPEGDDDDGGNGAQSEVDDYLSDADNYDGTIADFTGEDSVDVVNGVVEGTDQQWVFDPPAIRVDEGTEVTWTWSGDDSHSVMHDNGDDFDSGIEGGDGHTFEHTFDEQGTYLYVCEPHETLGQKGAVVVE